MLLKVIEDIDDVPVLEAIEGIISMINHIQDNLVDVNGLTEDEVF